jgi:hypothetical protein
MLDMYTKYVGMSAVHLHTKFHRVTAMKRIAFYGFHIATILFFYTVQREGSKKIIYILQRSTIHVSTALFCALVSSSVSQPFLHRR